jgi:NADPH:quinone reductase-like Zn-dependent oxidoreductase
MDLVVEGKLKPVIYRTLPLSQAADAHRLLASRDVFGKVLLLP